ncbi:AMSH-like ubiquitin thioesterase 2 [Sesamum angolense]|uniref:AMSH-like ubiquitin thioesterase 2 n=1 Tax=Sesamum angolense TaxID=2727404 RepID=A0AAE2BZ45_9LAMI|nr:AMSH-like ubiquitin thioesterase 2 [Sesamum angolense]
MAGETCCKIDVHSVTKYFPSPGISFLQPPPHEPETSRFSVQNAVDDQSNSSSNQQAASKHLKDIHMVRYENPKVALLILNFIFVKCISFASNDEYYALPHHFLSGCLMEDFLTAARENTQKNLETCGVLGAFLKDGTFYITTLIIPKQEATSDSCQAVNEEEIYAIQNEESLFPIGWIHTHPSQSCFMSSIDLHTQYTYQVMVPEAVGIVMAPTDDSRKYGIFRLSDPDGMSILRECHEMGFHTHRETSNGSPIYEDSTNIIFNPNLRLEIFDLR